MVRVAIVVVDVKLLARIVFEMVVIGRMVVKVKER